jgi:hypothetical protein
MQTETETSQEVAIMAGKKKAAGKKAKNSKPVSTGKKGKK